MIVASLYAMACAIGLFLVWRSSQRFLADVRREKARAQGARPDPAE